MATHSSSSSEQLEDEDISLSDLPHIFIDPDKTTSSDNGNVVDAEEEFEFGASMRGSTFLADTEMCAADELFFKGQILPLRLSVSSDNGLITKMNVTQQRLSVSRSDCTDQHDPCHNISSSFKSSSTGISPNSSRSNSNSSTSTDTTNYTSSIASSKPKRVANVGRNQFYAHPSPKPQIQTSTGSRLVENVGSRRSKKSTFLIWDFFRLGLVRTPEQDLSKVTLRSNNARVTSTRINVSRNSSVNSNNSTPLSNCNINATTSTIANSTICNGENGNVSNNSTASPKSEKKSGQKFYHGCKCAFDDVVSSNPVVPKGNVDKESEVKHERQADKVKGKKDNGNNKRKQVKQDMSHQRTYEWLKGL